MVPSWLRHPLLIGLLATLAVFAAGAGAGRIVGLLRHDRSAAPQARTGKAEGSAADIALAPAVPGTDHATPSSGVVPAPVITSPPAVASTPERAIVVPGLVARDAPTTEHGEPGPAAAPVSPPVETAMLAPPHLPAAPSGAPLWQRNAIPFAAPPDHPMICIVIDDAGLDRRRTTRVLDLPGPLTISFMAYAQDLAGQAWEARRHGHELFLHVPMEPVGHADPGPNALLTNLSQDEVLRRLRLDLAAYDGYVGVNNHMGSRFTADPAGMATVLGELGRRGLVFLDSRTGPHTASTALAPRFHVPLLDRDIFLDNDESEAAVLRMLKQTEEVARRNGRAIAIGHPHDGTTAALAQWLPTLAAKGFVQVPISAIVRKQYPGG
ncbi:MAG: divergent polysaccharide deacetylase family protein [Azospirillaceae bacterium]|nr:divergent polysaccharide deacetylase family protein [Azospirillaceae bacterium]